MEQSNDDAFLNACLQECLLTAQWLLQVSLPNKKEVNWEKRKYALFLASNKEDNLLYRLPTDVSKMVIGFV